MMFLALLLMGFFGVQCRWIARQSLHAPDTNQVQTRAQLMTYLSKISPFSADRYLYVKPTDMQRLLAYPSVFPKQSLIWNVVWNGKRNIGTALFRESDPNCSGVVEKSLLHWMQTPDSELDSTGVPEFYTEMDFLQRLDHDSMVDVRKNELSIVLIYHPIMGKYHQSLWRKLAALEKKFPNRKCYLLCLSEFLN
jgi:hypothetical protein